METSNRVMVKDDSGNQFGVDLAKGERFEIPERYGRCKVLYRFDGNLWIEEVTNILKGSRSYYSIDLTDLVYTFLEGEKGPQDLKPVLEYDVSWTCMWSREQLEDERNGADMLKDRRASLFRLRNGMWAVFDLEVRAGARPYQMLSEEEAVDLLLREGYSTAELPDDLWELCERRRPRTRQPSSKCNNGRHSSDEALQPAAEEWFKAALEEQVKATVAEIGLLEDKVDFGAILVQAEQLLVEARRLAEWSDEGQLDNTAADMLLRIGDQWLALESILNANGFGAEKARWCTDDDRVGDAASCLHDLACAVRKNAAWFRYLPEITNTCLLSLAPDACMGMPHAVFAKRLAVAVELLRKTVARAEHQSDEHTDAGRDRENGSRVLLSGQADVAFSSDFRSCRWGNMQFTFTEKQAGCVRVLWESRLRGTPVLSQITILDEAESAMADSTKPRLRDLFREHPAWGTMIVKAGKGIYRLADPQ